MAIGAYGIINRLLMLYVMVVIGVDYGNAAHRRIQLWCTED